MKKLSKFFKRLVPAVVANPKATTAALLAVLGPLKTLGVIPELSDEQADAVADLLAYLLTAVSFVWALIQCPPEAPAKDSPQGE